MANEVKELARQSAKFSDKIKIRLKDMSEEAGKARDASEKLEISMTLPGPEHLMQHRAMLRHRNSVSFPENCKI